MWQTTRSVGCLYAPRLETINSFESAASREYNGLTLLLKGKIPKQLFVRVGVMRSAYISPDYLTFDVRLSKGFRLRERVRLTLLAESFHVPNPVNQRVDISDDGFLNSAGRFVAYSAQVGKALYPGEFVKTSSPSSRPARAHRGRCSSP